MPTDDEPHDERPAPHLPLPADDRLWRHPSEMGVHGPMGSSTSRSGRAARPATRGSTRSSGDRGARVLALGVVLVGAVVVAGTLWMTRPGRGSTAQRATAARAASATTLTLTATTAPTTALGNTLIDTALGRWGGRVEEPAPHAVLGVRAVDDASSVAAGARLTEVDAGGPAATSGLRVDDVVTAVAGAPITCADDLLDAVVSRAPGDEVAVEVRRGSETLHLTVQLG